MSSTPPAAHVCTLKRQRESNLNIQIESPDHKGHDVYVHRNVENKRKSFGRMLWIHLGICGGLSFSCQNLAEFGQTKYTICPWFEALEFASSASLARNLEMKKRTMAHTYVLGKYSV